MPTRRFACNVAYCARAGVATALTAVSSTSRLQIFVPVVGLASSVSRTQAPERQRALRIPRFHLACKLPEMQYRKN